MRTRWQSARDKELRGQCTEFRLWKRWRRDRLDDLLAGPYGEPAQALLAFLKTMAGPTALIDFIASGPWANADVDVQFEILSLLDAVIIKRRECLGLAPMDDSLPGQPENAFLILRARLSGEFPP
jgi:hypothetical protein